MKKMSMRQWANDGRDSALIALVAAVVLSNTSVPLLGTLMAGVSGVMFLVSFYAEKRSKQEGDE